MPKMNLDYKPFIDENAIKRARFLNSDHVKAKLFDSFVSQIPIYNRYVFGTVDKQNKIQWVKDKNNEVKTVAQDLQENIDLLSEDIWQRHLQAVKKGLNTRKRNDKQRHNSERTGKQNNQGKQQRQNKVNNKENR